jgi:hypothetical protein
LIAQRDDQLARADASWWERRWGRIIKITLGYGYQPWKALLFLAVVVAVSCMLVIVLGAHGALAQTDKTASIGGWILRLLAWLFAALFIAGFTSAVRKT